MRLLAILGVCASAVALVWSITLLQQDSVSDRTTVAFTSTVEDRTLAQPSPALEPPSTSTPRSGTTAPVRSGRFEDLALTAGPRPVFVSIDSLEVEAVIEPVGFDADLDEMEVPRSASVVGWYEFSPQPGDEGSSVLAAHVDWNGRKGAFYDLYRTPPGSIITVGFEDGSVKTFEVFAAAQYDKAELPIDQIFARDGEPILTLVTCGGYFDSSRGSYDDNVVVYARPLTSTPPAQAG